MEFKFKRTVEYYTASDGLLKMIGRYPFKELGIGDAVEITGKYLPLKSVRSSAFQWAKKHGVRFTTNTAGTHTIIITRIS